MLNHNKTSNVQTRTLGHLQYTTSKLFFTSQPCIRIYFIVRELGVFTRSAHKISCVFLTCLEHTRIQMASVQMTKSHIAVTLIQACIIKTKSQHLPSTLPLWFMHSSEDLVEIKLEGHRRQDREPRVLVCLAQMLFILNSVPLFKWKRPPFCLVLLVKRWYFLYCVGARERGQRSEGMFNVNTQWLDY